MPDANRPFVGVARSERAPRRRLRRPPLRPRRGGFALLVVIWGLGVIGMLVISFMTTARWRLQAASNIAGAAQAGLIAEGAINAAALTILAEKDQTTQGFTQQQTQDQGPPLHDGQPQFCSLQGALVAIEIQDEAGKVDLNSAPPNMLQAMFNGLGMGMQAADKLANAIVTFRTTPANEISTKFPEYDAAGKPFGPKQALFQSALELDQVLGVDPALFRQALPLVTVYSRRAGIDPQAASPGLFAALAGFSPEDVRDATNGRKFDRRDPRFPESFKQPGTSGAFTVHAEAILPAGHTAVREAVIDTQGAENGPYALRELRRGAARHLDELRDMLRRGAGGGPEC